MRIIILTSLLLISLQGYCQSAHNEEFLSWIKTQSPESLAKNAADITSKGLPIQIDSLTLLYGIYAVENEITMRVQVLATEEEFIDLLKMSDKTLTSYEREFKAMVTNMGCSQEVNLAYIKQGVDYRYLVTDNRFKKMFEVTVTDCP